MKTNTYAIYTVANDSFYEGIFTLIYSFYKHNPTFTGDFIVSFSKTISPLSKKNQKAISKAFKEKNIVFKGIDETPYLEIKKKANNPYTSKKIPGLLKLDMFKEKEYTKILYIDTDIIVTSNIMYMFAEKANLVTFRDVYTKKLLDKYGHKETITIKNKKALIPPIKVQYIKTKNWIIEKYLHNETLFFIANIPIHIMDKFVSQPFNPVKERFYFNSGFFMFDNSYLDGTYFSKLKNINMTQKFWYHVDQDVLNLGLLQKGKTVTYLDAKLNGLKTKYTNENFAEYKKNPPAFIHYVGKKPWHKTLKLPIKNPIYKIYKKIFSQDQVFTKLENIWKKYNKEAHGKK